MENKTNLISLGSKTAKAGFSNEDDIVLKFNNWKKDKDAREWLKIMQYKLEEIEKVEAIKLYGYKTDVQVQITIYFKIAIVAENISIKLVSNTNGFNQIDKRWVKNYIEMWNIPESISNTLKLYTGENKPLKYVSLRDERRMFFDEIPKKDVLELIEFINKNKILIISDIIKGRGVLSAGWMLVILKLDDNIKWVLKNINYALNVFSKGEVFITKQGNLKIGQIGMQRKGGDNGRDTANMLQFKINPLLLFKD